MNRRNILLYSLIMLVLSLSTLEVVAHALTGKNYLPSLPSALHKPPVTTISANFDCSNSPPVKNLGEAKDPQLRKLAYYQQVCHSAVTGTMMLFTDIPKDDSDAADMGKQMAGTLKEFSHYGIAPLVIAEPHAASGNIDYRQFENGTYDNLLNTYFQTIHSQGVTDQQMGTWVPFSESNLPYWGQGTTTPADFAANVNKYLTIAQTYFPKLQGSVLLNSATYSADDFNWANGEYLSLVPYVKGLNPKLVQSFGLEGFPWMPPASENGAGIFDASEFLNYKLAQEAADTMHTKKIWLNTGTFGTKYAGDPTRQVHVDAAQRADILSGILSQAQVLQKKGYNVSVNLFSQNKSQAAEATDWSYFSDSTTTTSQASPVFANFAARLKQNHIALWLFDKEG